MSFLTLKKFLWKESGGILFGKNYMISETTICDQVWPVVSHPIRLHDSLIMNHEKVNLYPIFLTWRYPSREGII